MSKMTPTGLMQSLQMKYKVVNCVMQHNIHIMISQQVQVCT